MHILLDPEAQQTSVPRSLARGMLSGNVSEKERTRVSERKTQRERDHTEMDLKFYRLHTFSLTGQRQMNASVYMPRNRVTDKRLLP